jgi:hypothetical protein
MFGRMQVWMNGDSASDRQILMMVRGDKSMTTSDIRNSSSPLGGTQGMHDVKQKVVKLCGGSQQAQYFTAQGEGGNGSNRTRQQIEGMMTTIGDSKYFVLYIRPAAMQADMQAENSLYSLCPKTS